MWISCTRRVTRILAGTIDSNLLHNKPNKLANPEMYEDIAQHIRSSPFTTARGTLVARLVKEKATKDAAKKRRLLGINRVPTFLGKDQLLPKKSLLW